MKPLSVPLSDGGLKTEIGNGEGYFFKEYPIVASPPHVLNGMIYCLFGIYEFHLVTGNMQPKSLFDKGVTGVKRLLSQFDADIWSRYALVDEISLRNHYLLASPAYQKLHVEQLEALYFITGDVIFRQYAERFEKQHSGWFSLIIYPAYVLYKDGNLALKKLTLLLQAGGQEVREQ